MRVDFPQIGDVQFVSSAAARQISISIRKSGDVRVTFPRCVPACEAADFVRAKTGWILGARQRMLSRVSERTVFTPDTLFVTMHRQLKLIPWKSLQFRSQTSKDLLKVFYPHEMDILCEQAQAAIRACVIRTLRKEAAEYLPQRTEQLAAAHGLCYCGVTVKNVSSRWGSCSSKNHINLNIHLVRLPEHLSDYVILHELTHTVHKNHGAQFWKSLNALTGRRAKQLAAEMKQYSAVLF